MIESFARREFGGADLGDRGLAARLVRMGTAAMARPDASLPKMMSTDAELEARGARTPGDARDGPKNRKRGARDGPKNRKKGRDG